MANYHLAQINVGKLLAPISDPRIAGFVEQLDAVNALAEATPGFVWRLQDSSGNATGIAFDSDPAMMVNLSVWESLESLHQFSYQSAHLEVFKRRREWFVRLEKPHYCLWWVPAGHLPTVAEGRERLLHYQEHGSTPFSFWFSQPFPAPRDGRESAGAA